MQTRVQGINFDLADDVREYAEKKVSRLEKFFQRIQKGDVELVQEKTRFKAEGTLHVPGHIIRAEVSSEGIYDAVDLLADKLERQIQRYKAHFTERRRVEEPTALPEEPPAPEPADSRVVRRKSLELKPMSAEEAILQMELLGHEFFVFLNSEDGNQVNVLYKRKDGDYGLLAAS